MMKEALIAGLRATLVLALLTGLAFPLAITGISQAIFPNQANGSLLKNRDGKVIGSALIGQKFEKPEYFHTRPSAAGSGWAGEASAGTNLGPVSSKLILGKENDPATEADESYQGIKQLAQQYKKDNQLAENELPPVDAVTRSGSGLDPHISEANALFQARRVANVRGRPLEEVVQLVHKNLEGRDLGIFGEPRVNVLTLNLALGEFK